MHLITDPKRHFSRKSAAAIPVHLMTKKEFSGKNSGLDSVSRAWARSNGFTAASGQLCKVPGSDGEIALVLFGLGSGTGERKSFAHAKLARSLPHGRYVIAGERPDLASDQLAWALGGYSFDRYRQRKHATPTLSGAVNPDTLRIAQGVFFTRDLINTPANDLGPDALEAAFRKLAKAHGARVRVVKGENLLKQNFPMVHAVGRASAEAPRVLDLVWGKASHRKVTLVGKGVTFDTGGLNIKPGSSMALMKKDMGGAANVMGLAHMIMDARLPIRLRVIVGAVENAIAGNAFRPGDILPSRKGISVEIGNTDAEGRLVLGDCLALGDEDKPDLMIDMATLTGAARIALGPDLPPFYTHDDGLAAAISNAGSKVSDPVWRMPLWAPYQTMLSSKVADVNHISTGGFAGSITAALFLSRFVNKDTKWAHFDIFGWVPSDKPWAATGGEAQAIRALYEVLKD
ncbi:MAG: leucyl aminopeptidase family protein [Rhizobiaceae bacterium]